jgi:general secretion pathway protein H
MVSPAVMASTPTSAAGSEPGDQGGFTLIELLVVIAIVAVATVGVQLSLSRSSGGLPRQAEQLSAWIEVVRADARANGTTLRLKFEPQGVTAQGPGLADRTHVWAAPYPQAQVALANGEFAAVLRLPPEPVIGATTIVLTQGAQSVQLHTDGLAALSLVNR